MMVKVLKRLVLWVLLFCAIGYGGIFWLSVPPKEPVIEFPWWEEYAHYWKMDWIKVVDQFDRIEKGLRCTQLASRQQFGMTVLTIQYCHDNRNDKFVWKRYGLFGLITGYKTWSKKNYRFNENRDNGLFQWFPHGPFSYYTPRKPKAEKAIYERQLTDQEVVDAFIKLTTELEYDPYGNHQRITVVGKRTAPLRLIVDDFTRTKLQPKGELFNEKTVSQWVDELLSELSGLTGLEMQRIERGEGVENHVVAFLYADQREDVLAFINNIQQGQQQRGVTTGYFLGFEEIKMKLYRKDSKCFDTSQSINGVIISANTFIFLDEKADVPGCIHEEIAQSLGLDNDLRELEPTVFNDYSPHRMLTSLDKLMLQLLYNDKIKPGMTAEQLRPVVGSIVKGFRAKGKLDLIKKRAYPP